MINYIIQIILFQTLFLAVYDLFLQKETFFKWNRAYLLMTPILSFIIPLLRFESLQKTVPQEYVILLPEVVLNPQKAIESVPNSTEAINYLEILFYVGIAVVSMLFLMKLYKIARLIVSNNVIKKENYSLILLSNQATAFSFFNYIFIDKKLLENGELHIIEHELVHSKQYHTIDLLFFEFFKILMWFNPMIYSYQKRITLLHEYISDAEVVKQTTKNSYFNNILATTFNVQNISFVNQFYKHSLIKKRVIMITKEKSKKMKQLKYLVLVPLLASMLFYTSCTDESMSQKEIAQKETLLNEKLETERISDKDDVSFAIIDKSPTFPGCEGTIGKEAKDCFNKGIRTHVAKSFDGKLARSLDLTGKQKIYVKFKITKTGEVEILGARAPHPKLEEEARRVVNSLPKMVPGEQDGKAVNVLFMLPIAFNAN